MSIGNFLEVLSQAILVGIILLGRLGVPGCTTQSLQVMVNTDDGKQWLDAQASPARGRGACRATPIAKR